MNENHDRLAMFAAHVLNGLLARADADFDATPVASPELIAGIFAMASLMDEELQRWRYTQGTGSHGGITWERVP